MDGDGGAGDGGGRVRDVACSGHSDSFKLMTDNAWPLDSVYKEVRIRPPVLKRVWTMTFCLFEREEIDCCNESSVFVGQTPEEMKALCAAWIKARIVAAKLAGNIHLISFLLFFSFVELMYCFQPFLYLGSFHPIKSRRPPRSPAHRMEWKACPGDG